MRRAVPTPDDLDVCAARAGLPRPVPDPYPAHEGAERGGSEHTGRYHQQEDDQGADFEVRWPG